MQWLKTEYDQTIATANMAGKYNEFKETADLYPNLQYVTVGDNRVRAEHKKWDGFIAPINHAIWKTMLPPNDWACRCDVIPSDESPSKGFETYEKGIKAEFKNNAAISGKVFNNSTYEKTLTVAYKKEAKENVNTYLKNKA